MQKGIKLTLKIITTVLVCAIVFFAASISVSRIFGFQIYGVLTGSMEPVYPTGSLIYVREINTDKLEVGDVITFRLSQNVLATHRIVEIVPDENQPNLVRYRTKGDANDVVDSSLVNKYDIVGKVVFCIPKMGYFMDYIQSPKGLITVIGISILMVILVFASEIYTAQNSTKARWKNAILKHVLGVDVAALQPQPQRGNRPPQGRASPQQRARYDQQRQPARRPEQPRSRYEEQPRRRPEQPRSRYEEQPRRRYEEQPRSRYEEQPRRRYEEQPRSRYEEQPRRRPEQPRSRYEEQPRSRYEEAPRRSTPARSSGQTRQTSRFGSVDD